MFVGLDPGAARKAACPWLPSAAPPALVKLTRGSGITIYDSRFSIHNSRQGSAAYRRQDGDFRSAGDRRVEELLAADVFAIDKDVHMRPQLTLFIYDAITQAYVQFPQFVQRFPNSRGRGVHGNLTASVREIGEKTGNVESDHD